MMRKPLPGVNPLTHSRSFHVGASGDTRNEAAYELEYQIRHLARAGTFNGLTLVGADAKEDAHGVRLTNHYLPVELTEPMRE